MSVVKSFHIKRYQIHFYQTLVQNWFGCEAKIVCIVECYEDEGGEWGDGKYLCKVYFLTEDSETPPNFNQPQNNAGGIFLRAKELGPFIEMLRNEKPVSAYLNSQLPDHNQIFTGQEPIGEEEHRALFLRK